MMRTRTYNGMTFELSQPGVWVRWGGVGEHDILITRWDHGWEVHVHSTEDGSVIAGPWKGGMFETCAEWARSRAHVGVFDPKTIAAAIEALPDAERDKVMMTLGLVEVRWAVYKALGRGIRGPFLASFPALEDARKHVDTLLFENDCYVVKQLRRANSTVWVDAPI